jgi:hypothetical protein
MPENTRRALDEVFWQTFADRYEVQSGRINLENGYFGRMSRTRLLRIIDGELPRSVAYGPYIRITPGLTSIEAQMQRWPAP